MDGLAVRARETYDHEEESKRGRRKRTERHGVGGMHSTHRPNLCHRLPSPGLRGGGTQNFCVPVLLCFLSESVCPESTTNMCEPRVRIQRRCTYLMSKFKSSKSSGQPDKWYTLTNIPS